MSSFQGAGIEGVPPYTEVSSFQDVGYTALPMLLTRVFINNPLPTEISSPLKCKVRHLGIGEVKVLQIRTLSQHSEYLMKNIE